MDDQILFHAAIRFHEALPERIRKYLRDTRGIADEVIDAERLGWNGVRITIPIFNREGGVAVFKLARDPEDDPASPKMLTTPGGRAELYGWGSLLRNPQRLIICEGEFDRLVLESRGIPAVTSTAGARTFRPEWAREIERVPEIYICFDRDEAGREGSARVATLLPAARIAELPEEVGDGGDVSDFFVRLGRGREAFETLLASAGPRTSETAPTQATPPVSVSRDRIEAAKAAVSIEDVVRRYVELSGKGTTLTGVCPFHDDHFPSFVVYRQSGRFVCFGCGKRGDVITFLREVEYLSFSEALERLERMAGHHERAQEQQG